MKKSSGEEASRAGARRLDPEALARLTRQGGDELVGQLLASFRVRTPMRIADAEQAILEERWADVARVFHSLKSSAGLVGAQSIQADASTAEAAANAHDPATVRACMARIEAAYQALLPELGDTPLEEDA